VDNVSTCQRILKGEVGQVIGERYFLRSEVHTYATILQLHKEWDEIDEIEMRHVDDKQCWQIHHSEAWRWVSFKSGHPRLLQGKKRATIVDSLLQNHKKRRRGSTLIHSYSGNNICRSSFLPDNPFSHLLVSITSTRGSPGAVSPKLQVLDSLLPQVVEKADGRIRGKDGCFSRSRNLCKLEQVLKLKNIFGEVGLAPIFEGLFETSFFKAIYILVKY